MFANCSLNGTNIGFLDVCNTPAAPSPIPLPYPNTALVPMALPATASLKHFKSFMPSHNLGTQIPMTNGDNAGVLGGVASGIFMGPSRHTRCSTKVFVGGMPATRWLDNTVQNMTNCPCGTTVVPSQFKVIYLS